MNDFQQMVWNFYHEHKRDFVWRKNISPYHVVVSELMLQQTQTFRVETKFIDFIAAFPDFNSLAAASFADILMLWKGLGYNRRARYLQQIAQNIINEYAGVLPDNPKLLENFPGIGAATASSIVAFAYNLPTVFIETNIRAVFLHHFFASEIGIHDRELLPLVQANVDKKNPREWYYALMDYGVHLKKTQQNPSTRSAHHNTQSKFKGSNRQVRGKILELLLQKKQMNMQQLCEEIANSLKLAARCEEMTKRALEELCVENSVSILEHGAYELSK